ncbi:HTH domain-containing protein (plasmid) [Rothia amarae]|uniref:HTH domain-containing protein n=2 Tax=Rothia TaxID=32207 RepID=A0A7S6WWJ5_9MICC|nr:HTH domain-containing protein [Rothia terrae]QOW64805.1 HTH domain-containing protein [Rothia terrae]QOW64940.1 HTH domain-containing protein [Rothia amarae]
MGTFPSWLEIEKETGVSRATVARHVAALKKSGDHPEL